MEVNANFSLNPENIFNIPFDKYEKDFTFIVNGKQYKTNRIFADILSPNLRKLHFTDSSVNEFTINTKELNKEGDHFDEFLKLSTFQSFDLDPKLQKLFSKYFYFLGNIKEYYNLQPIYSTTITAENAIDLLVTTDQISIEIPHEIAKIKMMISFIAKHFESIDKSKLKRLDVEVLNKILSNENLRINDEDSLFQFIIEMYEEDQSKSPLFENIIFSNISNESLELFINKIKLEDMSVDIWQLFRDRLSSKTSKKVNSIGRYNFEVKEFKHEKEFNGIMHYLTSETGSNIHDNGTIEINSNSIRSNCHPKNLVDFNKSNNYDSLDEGDAKIVFDFKEKLVQIDSYSIKTNDTGPNGSHLKNWVVEVSNDAKNWVEIDCHENDPTLNGPNIISNFTVKKSKKEFYRFIQLRQTGNSWYQFCNHNRFWFFLIEFFGKLKQPAI